MKKNIALFLLLISVFAYSQNRKERILKMCDSLAAAELQEFDAKSQRQTGVPIALEHMDKMYSEKKPFITVTYTFNQNKYYGKDWKPQALKDSDKFPYAFIISMNTDALEMNFIDHR